MATLGLTKLEAVNLILQGVGEPRVTDLTSNTAADAEYYLDLWDRKIQGLGWPENTEYRKPHAPSGGAITLASDTLWVRAAGDDSHRTLVPRLDQLYDVDARTATFGGTVYLDVCKKLAFIDLAPSTKELIVDYARMNYSVHRKGDPMLTQFHATQTALFDVLAQRILPKNRPEVNPAPLIAGALARSQPQNA